MWNAAHLRRNWRGPQRGSRAGVPWRVRWRIILLFVVMVLLPALIFSVLIVRAVRTERTRVANQAADRQRQIVRLVEADLNNWLFSTDADSAISRSLFRFQLEGDRIVFPDVQLSLPSTESPRRFPFAPTPAPTVPATGRRLN